MRRRSLRASPKRPPRIAPLLVGVLLSPPEVPLPAALPPALISAPFSTLRAVMIPAKGAVTRWNDWRATNRWTLAWLAFAAASAAATSDRLASNRVRAAWTLASPERTLPRAAATFDWLERTLAPA